MEPSETEIGRSWVANFSPTDQPAAKLLLDSIEYIGQDQLRSGLQQLLRRLSKKIANPIALVPVRELAINQSYYNSDRNAKPNLLLSNSFPGSEAIIANIAGNMRRAHGNQGPFVAAPSLSNLRHSKCRTVLFLDDFSGSGDRILKFFKAFKKHKTISSWQSYKLITFHVATFSATKIAYDRLCGAFGKEQVHILKFAPTFSSQQWSEDDLSSVKRVCKNYCHGEDPYGYLGTEAMIAFSHSAPNNLPTITWQSHVNWASFFHGKSVPEELVSIFGQPRREYRLDNALKRLNQRRLLFGHWKTQAGPFLKNVLLILAALAARPRNENVISELTGLSLIEIETILIACRGWGLVGQTLHLTDAGKSELMHAKSVRLPFFEFSLQGSAEPYYPRKLRVGR